MKIFTVVQYIEIIRWQSFTNQRSAHCECLWFHPGKSSDARFFKETDVGDFVDGLSPDYHFKGDGAFIMLSRGMM